MEEDRRILISKEKEARSEAMHWELSQADCGFRQGLSHNEVPESKNPHYKRKLEYQR